MPLQETSGAASYDAFGGGAAAVPTYIEDVFSTYLYTASNQVAQTITNGINLSGKGGLVWIKARSAAYEHFLADTARGAANYLQSQSTAAQINNSTELTSFNSNGFSIGTDSSGIINYASTTLTSWTFRKQPKFFDVVTYTGSNSAQTISHSLGSAPGCIIIKKLDSINGTADWSVYHRSLTTPNEYYLALNTTAAQATYGSGVSYIYNVTSTSFSLGGGFTAINRASSTYVAYLFAHDAGGFGLTGTDNVISCGSFTTDGSENSTTNLGYEPQWLLLKASSGATSASQPWRIFDNMRGLTVAGQDDASLQPNNSNAESQVNRIGITSTGFTTNAFGANETFIYIAIRRGPMKTPTTGTSVFYSAAIQDVNDRMDTGFTVDMVIDRYAFWNDAQVAQTGSFYVYDRLRGSPNNLTTNSTSAETTSQPSLYVTTTGFQRNDGVGVGPANGSLGNWYAYFWNFRRAPSFFDEVCYTGNGPGTQVVSHNLGVVPELVINKTRSAVNGWTVFQGSTTSLTGFLRLNTNNAQGGDTLTVSSTSFTADSTIGFGMNTSGTTYVTYLFASCPGVSKVGRFTGTGATQTISCGFAARFVMIKRFDSTGDWWVWDTARGMVAGTDPRLALNSTVAQSNANWVYTDASGFQIVTTDATVNASGGSYIYLCVA